VGQEPSEVLAVRVGVADGRLVLISEDANLDVERASNGRFGSTPESMFDSWDEFVDWANGVDIDEEPAPLEKLENPVPCARQVFGVGANYRDHIEESGAEVPTAPLIFTKFPSCLVGPQDEIPLPSRKVDWEVELVVVIGRRAEHIDDGDAWRFIAGFTVGQDISERVLQFAGPFPQFSLSKSFPGFGPLGPMLVTVDEFEDANDLELGCALDTIVKQESRTSNLLFGVPELVSRLSATCILLPGDLIFTGTPAGVGAFRSPRQFLQPGQTLTSWVRGIGELRNPIVAGPKYVAKQF